LATQEVIAAVAGVGASAPNVTKRVRMGLRYLAKRGAVAKEGERKTARWALADS
jgi:hypothetical protein